MLVYILAGFVAYLSLKNYERVEFNELTKENKWLKIFYKNSAIFVLVVVFGFRDYSVGTDTISYLDVFNRLGTQFTNYTYVYEKGFSFISILVNKIFGNFTIFLLLLGLILYWNIVTSFCELSKSPSISMLCYFGLGSFAQSCNILRQYIALSFCLIALCFLLKKNNIKRFIMYVFLGFLFHKTALVFLLVIPLKYIKFNIKTTIVAIVLFCLIIPLIPFIVKISDYVFKGVKYSAYLRNQTTPFTLENIGTIVIMLSVIFVLVIFKTKAKILKDNISEYDFFSNMFLMFVGVFLISMFTSESLNRIALFFIPSVYFLIPIALKNFDKPKSCVLTCLMVLVFIILLYYLLIIRGSYGIIPYTFI